MKLVPYSTFSVSRVHMQAKKTNAGRIGGGVTTGVCAGDIFLSWIITGHSTTKQLTWKKPTWTHMKAYQSRFLWKCIASATEPTEPNPAGEEREACLVLDRVEKRWRKRTPRQPARLKERGESCTRITLMRSFSFKLDGSTFWHILSFSWLTSQSTST